VALVVENGTGLADANTYASVETLKAYAKARGESVPSSSYECEQLLLKAMDYMTGLDYVGDRQNRLQPLDWPRVNVVVDNFPYGTNELPRYLEQAQCALAIEAGKGLELLPSRAHDAPGRVVEDTVGPITTIYENQGRVNQVPAIAKAEVLLRRILKRSGLMAIRS
jgi:hypothetical protein